MGFRPAAAIAQCGTWCVADAATEIENSLGLRHGLDYNILTYIDNILVIAQTSSSARLVTEVITRRAAVAGLRLNEHTTPRPHAWSPEPSQVFEFLGDEFNLATGTVRQAEKTAKKVQLVDAGRWFGGSAEGMTKRQLAAVVGLFLFASGCCADVHQRHNYYCALRFYRDQTRWDKGSPPNGPNGTDPSHRCLPVLRLHSLLGRPT
jgi:hypothetical protein